MICDSGGSGVIGYMLGPPLKTPILSQAVAKQQEYLYNGLRMTALSTKFFFVIDMSKMLNV